MSTCQGKSLEGTIPCANLIDPPAVCAVESLSEDHNPLDEGLDEERVSRTSASAVPVSKCLVSWTFSWCWVMVVMSDVVSWWGRPRKGSLVQHERRFFLV